MAIVYLRIEKASIFVPFCYLQDGIFLLITIQTDETLYVMGDHSPCSAHYGKL